MITGACADPTPAFDSSQTLGGVEISAETLNRGRLVYGNFCASCHGASGAGDGPSARSLAQKPADFRAARFPVTAPEGDLLPEDQALFRVISEGRPDSGMPAFPHLTAEDRKAVAHFIKTFSPRWRDDR